MWSMLSEWQVARYAANSAIHLHNAYRLRTNLPCLSFGEIQGRVDRVREVSLKPEKDLDDWCLMEGWRSCSEPGQQVLVWLCVMILLVIGHLFFWCHLVSGSCSCCVLLDGSRSLLIVSEPKGS